MHKSNLLYKIGKTKLQTQLSTLYRLKHAHSVLRIISNFLNYRMLIVTFT
jgi:hypothetical protein